mgnify:FL=1
MALNSILFDFFVQGVPAAQIADIVAEKPVHTVEFLGQLLHVQEVLSNFHM